MGLNGTLNLLIYLRVLYAASIKKAPPGAFFIDRTKTERVL
ncbi:hypothetical protein HMPREF0201_03614 [Cedecea davisae DSM 4568]|uniref:Uncharacterized protein n=1 Tax=Cedecea davisae DSM 4568 TaxID=566551 RepID=S3J4L0_9ENTR|nr:hypothetical protein HMPREF0201_03614 [Cedecea davisae DSM 4568]